MSASEEQAYPAGAAPSPPKQDLALPNRVTVKPEGEGPHEQWVASVDDLPGSEARGETPDQAIENLRSTMESWISAAVEEPRVISARRPSRRKRSSGPSGKFLVRMPSSLHEELARAAEREEVSLNRFVTTQLEASVSAPGTAASSAASVAGQPAPARRRPHFRFLIAVNLAVIVLAAAAAITLLILALQHGA